MPFIRGIIFSSALLDGCPQLREQLPLLRWGGLQLAELRPSAAPGDAWAQAAAATGPAPSTAPATAAVDAPATAAGAVTAAGEAAASASAVPTPGPHEGVDTLWLGTTGAAGAGSGDAEAEAEARAAETAEAAASSWAASRGLAWPGEVVLLPGELLGRTGTTGSSAGVCGGSSADPTGALLRALRQRWQAQRRRAQAQAQGEQGGTGEGEDAEDPPGELRGYGLSPGAGGSEAATAEEEGQAGAGQPAWQRLRLALGHANLRRAAADAAAAAAAADTDAGARAAGGGGAGGGGGGGDSRCPLVLVVTSMKASRERDLAREGLLNLVPQDGIAFAPLDLSAPAAAQLPFHAVLHKASDELVAGPGGAPVFGPRVTALAAFAAAHPGVSLVDPLEAAAKVIDRAELAKVCESLSRITVPPSPCPSTPQGNQNVQEQQHQQQQQRRRLAAVVRAPRSMVVASFAEEEIAAAAARLGCPPPYIVKPLVACGTADSHRMALVGRLGALAALAVPLPAVLQEFVNHDATIYKVYVAGDKVFHTVRPSIPNISLHVDPQTEGGPNEAPSPAPSTSGCLTLPEGRLEFDSLKSLPIAPAAAALEAATHGSQAQAGDPGVGTRRPTGPSQALLEAVAAHLRSELGLSLFGFDVVIASRERADGSVGEEKSGSGVGGGRKRPREAAEAEGAGGVVGGAEGESRADGEEGPREAVVVDINYFPSYRGAPGAGALFRAAVLASHRAQQQAQQRG